MYEHDKLMKKAWRAIRRHSGLTPEKCVEAARHGADAGWSGFVYYTDTDKFVSDNEQLIDNVLYQHEINLRSLITDDDNLATARCRMAWVVLELVGRWIEDKWESVGRYARRSGAGRGA